jgi:hypothetical protein
MDVVSVRPSIHPSICPHDEIMRNLLTSKTVYVAIALRLGFGINLVKIFYALKLKQKAKNDIGQHKAPRVLSLIFVDGDSRLLYI